MSEPLTAAILSLTLAGTPLPRQVDVYRLAVPMVELQHQPQPAADSTPRRRTYIGTALGAAIGCGIGAAIGDSDNRTSGNCLVWGGVGAAVGAIAGRAWGRSQ